MSKIDPRITTALVTGAAQRNGRAIALWLGAQGVKVAVHYRSSKAAAQQTLSDVGKGAIVQGDLTHPDQAAHVVRHAAHQLGGLDLLVNNVGNYLRKDLFDLTPDEWRDQIESNLYSTFYCMQAAVRLMRENGFGRVVNLGYAGGERPTYNRLTVPYHIAKSGVGMLTRNAAAAVAKQNITINTIGVGIMENSIVKPDDPPAGRFAQYADLNNALAFLLSPESSHVNGTQIDVSGGWLPEQIL
jgi:NAD(P)-dependent dehydrogenase (short-subunit alcohol dehydrogenase family)